MLCLSTKHRVIAFHEVSRGTLDSTLVHPREVFKAALLANAAAIVVAHYVVRHIMRLRHTQSLRGQSQSPWRAHPRRARDGPSHDSATPCRCGAHLLPVVCGPPTPSPRSHRYRPRSKITR